MALSYNTGNINKVGNFPAKIMKFVVVLVVLGGVYTAGLLTHTAVAHAETQPIQASCKSYLDLILSGKLDQAYAASGAALKAAQTSANFTQLLAPLQTAHPSFLDKDIHTLQVKGNANCSYHVANLPKASDGTTDAVFTFGMSKEASNWKVESIQVQ